MPGVPSDMEHVSNANAKHDNGTSDLGSRSSSSARRQLVTVCQEMSGYSVAPDYDYYLGDNIGRHTSVSDGKAACDADPNCAGFNWVAGGTDGYTKSVVAPAVPSPGICLYTKIVTSCEAIAGYTVTADYDYYLGDNIARHTSLDAGKTACNNDASCKGFNWVAGGTDGYTKTVVAPASYSRGICLYTKKVTSCEAIAGYTVTADYDYSVGDNIARHTSADAGKTACNNDASCKGFNWVAGGTDGYTKTVVAPATYSYGICLYTKKDYSVGDNIARHTSADAGKTACNNDASCKGFNWVAGGTDGYTKTVVAPATYSYGICLYTKKDYSVGDNIARHTSADAGKTACNNDASCKGFNWVAGGTDGYTKTVVAPATYSYGICLYTKKDYSVGDNIARHTSADAGKTACNNDASCKGFNWVAGGTDGYTKTVVAPATYSYGICLYTKKDYSVGDNIARHTSADAGKTACNNDASCKGFNWVAGGTDGYTKTVVAPATYSYGICLYTKKDYSVGDNIARHTSADAGKTACNNDASCKGFNWVAGGTDGYTKTVVAPATYSYGICLYTKKDYSVGDNIARHTSADAGKTACNNDASCKGFNWVAGGTDGYTKTVVAPATYSYGICLYTKKDYSVGDNIARHTSADAGKTACNNDASCKGFNWVAGGTDGYTKTVVAPATYSYGICLYTKKVTSCEAIAGYTVTADYDYYLGDNIARHTSADAGKTACNNDANCAGFNWVAGGTDGYTKAVVAPASYSYGICLYTKTTPPNNCLTNKCFDRHAKCTPTSDATPNCGTCNKGFELADYAGNSDPSFRACIPSNNINICTQAPYLTPRVWVTCRDSDGCHNGFKWDSTKQKCVDRNECEDTPGICGAVATCIDIPWSYACACPSIDDHYPGGAYAGTFTFDPSSKTCVDATASPKCIYGTFRYNGACVDDPCLDANLNKACAEPYTCMAAMDGSSHRCICKGEMINGECRVDPCLSKPCPSAGAVCTPAADYLSRTCA
ncbi:hypothetical protein HXX76_009401 [Chlamydomonas incerta]|uniref:EGF-like domain-containing protein n=1 Tax=Chlamydomonas incerta TaxID=51695 RepID=A0A835T3Q9_CHLIN|nr:hypothetical protein HXX76_009401 [Chlamydomonas incerta]|eukprot:KAG2431910.1 hypothetical protein HXX76_009401 [Chlamydomonas incerta]